MARQAITVGFPSPNYVAQTSTRDAILPGTYVAETSGATPPPPPPATQRPWHLVVRTEESEAEYFPPRRPVAIAPTPAPPHQQKPWHHHLLHDEDEAIEVLVLRQHSYRATPPPPGNKLRPYLSINV